MATKSLTKNEKYLYEAFKLLKCSEALTISSKGSQFSDTEMRLLSEILSANYAGKRLISTQLAKLLGVTRSAISQIVNRLEKEGVVRRVPDAVDRKIAYIEVTEETIEKYSESFKFCSDFMGKVVDKYGEQKFYEMCSYFGEFTELVDAEKKNFQKDRK